MISPKPLPDFGAAARSALRRLVLVVASALLAACASPQATKGDEEATDSDSQSTGAPEAADAPAPSDLPKQELSDEVLYEFLLAEIAGQRGNLTLSAQAYADLAKRTRDPRVAERATEIALFARMPESAIDSAKVWADVNPTSTKALGTASSLLIRANRLGEAEPYLQKILAVQTTNRGDGFLQLNGLLAANPDKASNLRVIQELAAPYADLAQAHFAIAQAAASAGEDGLALKEVRTASQLAPDWEIAALYEASLLQKKSSAVAIERLATFLKLWGRGFPTTRSVVLKATSSAGRLAPRILGPAHRLLWRHQLRIRLYGGGIRGRRVAQRSLLLQPFRHERQRHQCDQRLQQDGHCQQHHGEQRQLQRRHGWRAGRTDPAGANRRARAAHGSVGGADPARAPGQPESRKLRV